jgi:hypothetical protein
MLSLVHTIVSLPFGVYLQNPIIIFLSVFIFHFVLDSIFHWNIYPPHHAKFPILPVSLDITGGLILAWLIVGSDLVSLPIIVAIIGSNAPDVFQSLWYMLGEPKSKRFPFATFLFEMHDQIQWETNHIIKGLIPQTALAILAIYLVL